MAAISLRFPAIAWLSESQLSVIRSAQGTLATNQHLEIHHCDLLCTDHNITTIILPLPSPPSHPLLPLLFHSSLPPITPPPLSTSLLPPPFLSPSPPLSQTHSNSQSWNLEEPNVSCSPYLATWAEQCPPRKSTPSQLTSAPPPTPILPP